jgi:DnaK suppressor protein
MTDTAKSPQDLEAVKSGLQARRAELTSRRDRVDRDQRHQAQPLSADFAEQAAETTNDDVLGAIGESVRAEIHDIDAALVRLAAGGYGTCARCGARIEPARLAAVPYALICKSCAAA